MSRDGAESEIEEPFRHGRISEGIPGRAVVRAAGISGHFRPECQHVEIVVQPLFEQSLSTGIVNAGAFQGEAGVELHQRRAVETAVPRTGSFALGMHSGLADFLQVLSRDGMTEQILSDLPAVGLGHGVIEPVIGGHGFDAGETGPVHGFEGFVTCVVPLGGFFQELHGQDPVFFVAGQLPGEGRAEGRGTEFIPAVKMFGVSRFRDLLRIGVDLTPQTLETGLEIPVFGQLFLHRLEGLRIEKEPGPDGCGRDHGIIFGEDRAQRRFIFFLRLSGSGSRGLWGQQLDLAVFLFEDHVFEHHAGRGLYADAGAYGSLPPFVQNGSVRSDTADPAVKTLPLARSDLSVLTDEKGASGTMGMLADRRPCRKGVP